MDDDTFSNINTPNISNSPGHPYNDAIVSGSSSQVEPFQFHVKYLKKNNVNLNHVNRKINLNERNENYFRVNNLSKQTK